MQNDVAKDIIVSLNVGVTHDFNYSSTFSPGGEGDEGVDLSRHIVGGPSGRRMLGGQNFKRLKYRTWHCCLACMFRMLYVAYDSLRAMQKGPAYG